MSTSVYKPKNRAFSTKTLDRKSTIETEILDSFLVRLAVVVDVEREKTPVNTYFIQ